MCGNAFERGLVRQTWTRRRGETREYSLEVEGRSILTLDEQWEGAEGSNDERSEHGERGLFVCDGEASVGCCEGRIPSGFDRSKGR